MYLIYQALRVALGRCRFQVNQFQNPLCCAVPTRICLRNLATSTDTPVESDDKNKPLSFLNSKAATYRINKIDPEKIRRQQRNYVYFQLPLSLGICVFICYLIFFAPPAEDEMSEEDLIRLLEAFEGGDDDDDN